MNQALIQKVTGIQGTGPVIRRDVILTDYFVGHFDFNSTVCRNGYVSGPVPVNHRFRNLVDGGEDAVVTAAYTGLTTKGLRTSDGTGFLQLPASFRLPAGTEHFAFCIWASYEGALPASGVLSLGGFSDGTATDNQYAISANTCGGVVSNIRGHAENAAVVAPSGYWPKFDNGVMHQYVIEYEELPDDTADRRLYIDGVLVATYNFAVDGILNDPEDPNVPGLGRLNQFIADGFKGRSGRTWLVRPDLVEAPAVPELSVAQIVRLDWDRYGAVPRFVEAA